LLAVRKDFNFRNRIKCFKPYLRQDIYLISSFQVLRVKVGPIWTRYKKPVPGIEIFSLTRKTNEDHYNQSARHGRVVAGSQECPHRPDLSQAHYLTRTSKVSELSRPQWPSTLVFVATLISFSTTISMAHLSTNSLATSELFSPHGF
jgi:hypothetical protein